MPDPFDEATSNLDSFIKEKEMIRDNISKSWNILRQYWASDIQTIIAFANPKLSKFRFVFSQELEVNDQGDNGFLIVKAAKPSSNFQGFNFKGTSFPSLKLSIVNNGNVSIVCAQLDINVILPIDNPLSRQSLSGILANYAEAAIKRSYKE